MVNAFCLSEEYGRKNSGKHMKVARIQAVLKGAIVSCGTVKNKHIFLHFFHRYILLLIILYYLEDQKMAYLLGIVMILLQLFPRFIATFPSFYCNFSLVLLMWIT